MTLTFKTSQQAFQPFESTLRRFANASVVCEGWYPVGRANAVKNGSVTRAWIGKQDVVLYRDRSGTLHAVERACPHLGADLSLGRVVEKGLQCAFHAWCWGKDGSCVAGGGVGQGRRIRTYAVRERWGLAWVWAGGAPLYELPMPDPANQAHIVRLPPQRLACHPHVMLGNGLDLTHVGPVHRFYPQEDPAVDLEPPHRLSVNIHARFGPTFMRRILGLAGRNARFRFTTIGPSLAWLTVTHPTPFELVWAGRPLPEGGCAAQTVFFLPSRRSFLRALPMMIATTWADRRVLNGIEFRPGFVASDAVFALYAQLVEQMPEWSHSSN